MGDASELKPCPFCGDQMELWNKGYVRHVEQGGCPIGQYAFPLNRWTTNLNPGEPT